MNPRQNLRNSYSTQNLHQYQNYQILTQSICTNSFHQYLDNQPTYSQKKHLTPYIMLQNHNITHLLILNHISILKSIIIYTQNLYKYQNLVLTFCQIILLFYMKILQKILIITNLLLLLSSVTAFVLTIYLYAHTSVFVDSAPMMKKILMTVLVFQATIAIASIFGILTRNMTKKSLVILNIIGGILFTLIFVGVGIGSHFVPSKILGNQSCDNSDVLWIQSGKKAYNLGPMFCFLLGCTCDMHNYQGYNSKDIQMLNITRPFRNSHNDYHNIKQCYPFILSLRNDNYTLGLTTELSKIQEHFECSGWCSYTEFSLIYIFSNVNNGKPKQACFPAIVDFTHKSVRIGGGFAYSIGLLQLIILMVNIIAAKKIFFKKATTTSYGRFQEETGEGLYRSQGDSFVQR